MKPRHAAALALVDYRCRLNSRGELLRTGPLISAPSSSFHFLQNVRRKHIGIVRGYEQTPLMLARVRLRRRRRQAIGLRSRLIGLRRGGTSSQHQNQRQSSIFTAIPLFRVFTEQPSSHVIKNKARWVFSSAWGK